MYKVSVIVPVYKVAPYIERCARSLFASTLEDVEYIFVDDCSPDNSVSLLKQVLSDYPDRKPHVRIISHGRNKGVSSARNTGLDCAAGEYIAYCDGDDFVSPQMYERLYAEAKETNADICYCDFNAVHSDRVEKCETVRMSEKESFIQNYIRSGWNFLWYMIVRRRLYEAHRLRFPGHVTYCEDFWMTVRLFYLCDKISKVPACLYNYNRTNASSLLHALSEKTRNDELFCYEDTCEFFRQNGVLAPFQKDLCWRILKCKQDLALNPETHHTFLRICPASHKYICSCPEAYCNRKIKVMMWLLVHHLGIIVTGLNLLRNLANRSMRKNR